MLIGAFNKKILSLPLLQRKTGTLDHRPTSILFLAIVFIKQMWLLCVLWTSTGGYTSIFPTKASTTSCTPQHTRDSLALHHHLASSVGACWQMSSNPCCQQAHFVLWIKSDYLNPSALSFATERVDSPYFNTFYSKIVPLR